MAYVRDYAFYADTGGTSITGALPNYSENDLLLWFPAKDNSGGGSWTHDGTGLTEAQNSTYTLNSAAFWKVAGVSESAVTFSTTQVEDYGLIIIAIADVDTSDPVNASSFEGAAGGIITTTGLVLDEDNCLVFYLHASDDYRYPSAPPGLMMLDPPFTNQFQMSAAWTWLFGSGAGGTAPAATYEQISNDRSQQVITIGINSNNSTPVIAPHCDFSSPPSELIAPMHSQAYTAGTFGGGSVDPTATVTAIGSITMNYTAPGTEGGGGVDGRSSAIRTGIGSSSATNEYWGYTWACTQKDLRGKAACMHFRSVGTAYTGSLDTIAAGGLVMGFRSDSTGTIGYRYWKVSGIDATDFPGDMQVGVVDIDDTAGLKIEDKGTFNAEKVDGVFYALKKGAGVSLRWIATEAQTVEPIVIIGGSSSRPAGLNTIKDSIRASNIQTVELAGGGKIRHAVQIGNGSNPTYWKDLSKTFKFADVAADRDVSQNIQASAHGLTIYATASCTINLSGQVWNGPVGWPFTIHTSSSASATYITLPTTIIGADPTLRDVFTAQSGITFSQCKEVTLNGADLSGGNTFDGCVDAQQITINGASEAALQALIDDVANCVFKNCAVAIRVEYTGSGDIALSFDNIKGSNNTVDVHYNATSASALTCNLSNGSNFSVGTFDGSATGISFVNAVSVKVTCKDATSKALISNARVYLKADTGGDLASGSQIMIDLTTGAGFVELTGFNYTNPQPFLGFARKFDNIGYNYKTAELAGTITSNGLDLTVFLIRE